MATVELVAANAGTRMMYTERTAFLDGRDIPASRRQGWGEILNKVDAGRRRNPWTVLAARTEG